MLRITTLIAVLIMLIQPALAMTQTTTAKQALVLDYETGQVLFEKDADKHMPTSSMSKVMTMYMVFDALNNGIIKMDSEFPVSEKAWRKGGSKMFVKVGDKVKIKDLIRGVIVQSGNDATIVLAEGLAGTESAFARKMTDKALEIGMENSNFMNASGWPDEGHYSTARDLATMSHSMIENFPEYYKFYSETEFTYSNIKQQNRNPLLYQNIGADGLKTGHTDIGGYGLIGTAMRDGRRVLMVVNGLESENDRKTESLRLIEWGLNGFINIDVMKAGQKLTQAPVVMGMVEAVPLVTSQDVKLTVPRAAQDKTELDITYKSPLIAPLKKGDEVGMVTIKGVGDNNYSYPLLAGADVERVGMFKETIGKMKYFLLGNL